MIEYQDCEPSFTALGIEAGLYIDVYGYKFEESTSSLKAKELWWHFCNNATDGAFMVAIFSDKSRGVFQKVDGCVKRILPPPLRINIPVA